jgi:hypothetical protein
MGCLRALDTVLALLRPIVDRSNIQPAEKQIGDLSSNIMDVEIEIFC